MYSCFQSYTKLGQVCVILFYQSDSLKVGISTVDVKRASSMNATISPKTISLSLLCSSETYSPSCLLDAVLYKLLQHALWYTASWEIMSPFRRFACKKESSNKFAHLRNFWSSLKDCTRCNGPFSEIDDSLQQKKVGFSSWEDFDVWH